MKKSVPNPRASKKPETALGNRQAIVEKTIFDGFWNAPSPGEICASLAKGKINLQPGAVSRIASAMRSRGIGVPEKSTEAKKLWPTHF